MTIQAEVFAKPGELLQGILPGNRPFLLSNKSSRTFRSITTVQSEPGGTASFNGEKAHEAAVLFMKHAPLPKHHQPLTELALTMESNIPFGKGLSSSSADILSVLHALNAWYQTGMAHTELYRLAALIEPTDPCLHEEQLFFDPRSGTISLNPGNQPFEIMYFDSAPETIVNTVDCAAKRQVPKSLQYDYSRMYTDSVEALASGNWSLFTTQLRRSAILNNAFLPKNNLSLLAEFTASHQLGMFVAHTGTFMGLLFPGTPSESVRNTSMDFIHQNWNTVIYSE